MNISSRTPEGELGRCPVCGHSVRIEPSRPPGDAPCPCCGTLLWFTGQAADSNSMAMPVPDLPEVVTAWEYGTEKLKRGDVATGLAVLQNVVNHEPQDVSKRKALRELERQVLPQHELDRTTVAMMLVDIWAEIRQARHNRTGKLVDWDAIDRAAERGLAVDPWETEFHLELGHACGARGYREAARFAYQCALELAPDRVGINEYLAGLGS